MSFHKDKNVSPQRDPRHGILEAITDEIRNCPAEDPGTLGRTTRHFCRDRRSSDSFATILTRRADCFDTTLPAANPFRKSSDPAVSEESKHPRNAGTRESRHQEKSAPEKRRKAGKNTCRPAHSSHQGLSMLFQHPVYDLSLVIRRIPLGKRCGGFMQLDAYQSHPCGQTSGNHPGKIRHHIFTGRLIRCLHNALEMIVERLS